MRFMSFLSSPERALKGRFPITKDALESSNREVSVYVEDYFGRSLLAKSIIAINFIYVYKKEIPNIPESKEDSGHNNP